MTTRLLALSLVLTVGCGTILNSGPQTVHVPAGSTLDGAAAGDMPVDPKIPHEIIYPDGHRCIVDSHISAGYVIADVVLWFLVGLVVDGVTGDWRTLNADDCPGVSVD